MYWKDILNGNHFPYREHGFQVVTAGHRSDSYFLSRLKDIIELSDYTMSNFVGTHIGYCISLGKPHYIIKQKYEIYGENIEKEFEDRRDINYLHSFKNEESEIIDAFDNFIFSITDLQIFIVEKHWGKNEILKIEI
jgi:hypothetical protein